METIKQLIAAIEDAEEIVSDRETSDEFKYDSLSQLIQNKIGPRLRRLSLSERVPRLPDPARVWAMQIYVANLTDLRMRVLVPMAKVPERRRLCPTPAA